MCRGMGGLKTLNFREFQQTHLFSCFSMSNPSQTTLARHKMLADIPVIVGQSLSRITLHRCLLLLSVIAGIELCD